MSNTPNQQEQKQADCFTCNRMAEVQPHISPEVRKQHHDMWPELHGPGIYPKWYCPECGQADGEHKIWCNTQGKPEFSFKDAPSPQPQAGDSFEKTLRTNITVVKHAPHMADKSVAIILDAYHSTLAQQKREAEPIIAAAIAWRNMRINKAAAVKPKPESAALLAAVERYLTQVNTEDTQR